MMLEGQDDARVPRCFGRRLAKRLAARLLEQATEGVPRTNAMKSPPQEVSAHRYLDQKSRCALAF